jgi:hypothetical protein
MLCVQNIVAAKNCSFVLQIARLFASMIVPTANIYIL